MKTYYYALVNENGNLITTDSKLPIYWNKEVAIKAGINFKAYSIKKINIADLKLITRQL